MPRLVSSISVALFAALLCGLLALFPAATGPARAAESPAGGASAFHGKWVFSFKDSQEYLKSVKHPDADRFNEADAGKDGKLSFRVDLEYGVFSVDRGEGSSVMPQAIKGVAVKGDSITLTLVDILGGEPHDLPLTLVGGDADKLECALFGPPLIFLREAPAPKASPETLKPLLGKWTVAAQDVVKRVEIKAVARPGYDGRAAVTARYQVGGKDTDVTRYIPFSVKAAKPDGMTLHIYPAEPFHADNGKGGSVTWLVEECDIELTFAGSKAVMVTMPRGEAFVLKRK